MKRLRNIRRIDNDANRTHAWFVQVQRHNRIAMKMFTDGVYGGKRKALAVALTYRDQLVAEAPSLDHQIWVRSRLRRNNTSGIPGVSRHARIANPKTGRRDEFWLASWVNEQGATRQRKFYVSCYGEFSAKQLAIAERARRVKEVCAAQCP